MSTEAAVETAVTDQPEAAPSILEHAALYGPNADKGDPIEEAPDPLKPIRPVDQQRRDQGKFAEGKQRIKSKDAVDRINQLTGRAKTAEESLAAERAARTAAETRLQTAERELAQLRAGGGTRQEIAKAEAKVERAEAATTPAATGHADPEPKEDDPKYGGDWFKYNQDHIRWAVRDERRQEIAREQAAAKSAAEVQTWDTRIAAARAKYGDFDAVVQPIVSRVGQSHIGDWLADDELAEDVLYYLGSHLQELDAILQMPTAHQQVRAVTLLSQRFASSPLAAVGSTTSTPERKPAYIPPKPPNVVRTEAQRASDGPPPTDGSLSIAEHARAFGRKSR